MDIAEIGTDNLRTQEYGGSPSPFTCPECGGALWEMSGGNLSRFRCHVGHGYTAETLLSEQVTGLEAALWTALRALDEAAALNRRMSQRADAGKLPAIAVLFRRRAEESEERASLVRGILVNHRAIEPDPLSQPVADNLVQQPRDQQSLLRPKTF